MVLHVGAVREIWKADDSPTLISGVQKITDELTG